MPPSPECLLRSWLAVCLGASYLDFLFLVPFSVKIRAVIVTSIQYFCELKKTNMWKTFRAAPDIYRGSVKVCVVLGLMEHVRHEGRAVTLWFTAACQGVWLVPGTHWLRPKG